MIKGALFYAIKQKPQHPDFEGVIELDGNQHKVVGWIKEAKTGKKYVSLAEKVMKEPKANYTNMSDSEQTRALDGDIPF